MTAGLWEMMHKMFLGGYVTPIMYSPKRVSFTEVMRNEVRTFSPILDEVQGSPQALQRGTIPQEEGWWRGMKDCRATCDICKEGNMMTMIFGKNYVCEYCTRTIVLHYIEEVLP